MANRKPSVWDEEMVARAAGLKRAGFPAKVIAQKLGVTARAVSAKMSRTGVKLPPYVRGIRVFIREQGKCQ